MNLNSNLMTFKSEAHLGTPNGPKCDRNAIVIINLFLNWIKLQTKAFKYAHLI